MLRPIPTKNRNFQAHRLPLLCAFLLSVALAGCTQLERPQVEPFYAVSPPPPKQELRWSNGKAPKTLDPARAVAAPEADIVRAVYEGLTDLDSKSLAAIPGVAEKWTSSEGDRTWTFNLRKDAHWSNGDRVTAGDFVRSWKRLRDLGDKTGSVYLYQNIIGMRRGPTGASNKTDEPADFLYLPETDVTSQGDVQRSAPDRAQAPADTETQAALPKGPGQAEPDVSKPLPESKFGVEAVDDLTLRVRLDLPDPDFAKLVSNPVFRPVYGDGAVLEVSGASRDPVTNGAFRVAEISEGGITLERSARYWNADAVVLERVRFVASPNAETALDGYRKGDIDVVTNAAFEPLALKILAPYEDFRRTVHSALNYYEVNTANAPFSDRRVREALALAIDREKLTEGELEGSTRPATVFLPLGNVHVDRLTHDVDRAHSLLVQAGYPDGVNFPEIRLVVNRNDTQQRVARTVARMWKQDLNLNTQIIVKDAAELEQARAAGEFDLIRRGVVLPSADEMVSLISIFGIPPKVVDPAETEPAQSEPPAEATSPPKDVSNDPSRTLTDGENAAADDEADVDRLAEENAMYEMNAIPLYFPMSFSLVKPYVRGFEMNGLDAPSLKEMSIDGSWQPKTVRN